MDARKAATEMQQVGRKFDSLNKKVGAIAKTAGIAFAATKIVSFTTEAAKLAGEAEGVSKAFKEIAQPGLLGSLQKATQGTVNNLELMRNSVQAIQLGLDSNQLAKYFEFATLRSQQTGQSVQELVDKLVLGIGRESVLRLDDLGLSAKRMGEEAKKAGSFVAGVGKIIDEELGKSEIIETTAQSFAQLDAEVENLKLEIGQGLTPAYKEFLTALRDSITVVKDFGDDNLSAWTKFVNLLGSANPLLSTHAIALKAVDKAQNSIKTNALTANQTALNKAMQMGLITAEDAVIVNGKLSDIQYEILAANSKEIRDYNLQTAGATNTALSINDLTEELKKLREEQNLATNYSQFAEIGAQIDEVNEKIKQIKAPNLEPVAAIAYKDATVDLTSAVYAQNEAFRQTQLDAFATTAAYNTAGEGVKYYQSTLTDLQQTTVETQEKAAALTHALGSAFSALGEIVVSSFGTAATAMGQFAQSILGVVIDVIARMLAISMAQAIAGATSSAASTGPGAVVATPVFIATQIAAVLGAFASIPAFANGGIVTGPTLAMVGEGAESEAILPLSKLQTLVDNTGGGAGVIPNVKITGEDLLIVFDRAHRSKNRVS